MYFCKLIVFVFSMAFSNSLRHRIIGGEVAVHGDIPYIVSLQWHLPSNSLNVQSIHVCGGSIISKYWILTAGHCLELPSNINQIAILTIIAGKINLEEHEHSEQRIFAQSTFKHYGYEENVNTGTNDIALIKLSKSLKWTEWVAPIELPQSGSEPTGSGILSGWGATTLINDTYNTSVLLHSKSLPIIERSVCNAAVEAVALEDEIELKDTVFETDICTGPLTGGFSLCDGDSGGPLTSVDSRGKLVLIGVATWAMLPCGRRGAPSVYVRVSLFIDWIRTTISDNTFFRYGTF
ncbi:PREDICTED: trypsin-1-like [Ceratosolen solmsi marchali]|uniref:Trypsin-1-like n=1 Tax=Ceratosolen solmsi marchali TaxID=326594 RepID=A0AAJ6YNB6_9HYME|nr:PREDICTED: trypsin-1-like [Ceratosolen solmsi marchali]